jgi:hypothetical protein
MAMLSIFQICVIGIKIHVLNEGQIILFLSLFYLYFKDTFTKKLQQKLNSVLGIQ